MCSLMYFEVLGSREHLLTAGQGAGEWLLAGVDPDVVDQLVLGLERSTQPTTIFALNQNYINLEKRRRKY